MTTGSINVRLENTLSELDRARRWMLGSFVGVNLLFPTLLFVAAWPRPWKGFAGEESPINWLSTIQCTLIALIAFGVWALTEIGRRAGTEPLHRRWPWLAFSGGFLAMAADERFRGHELIREKFLKPRGVLTEVDFLLPGDVALIGYVVVGLVLSWFLLEELRQIRASLIYFVAAIVLIGISAVQDSLDLPFFHTPSFRHFQTVAEELAEVWAQMLFAFSFLLVFFQKARNLLRGLASDPTG